MYSDKMIATPEDNFKWYELEDYMQLRKNPGAFKTLCESFLPHVVSVAKWNRDYLVEKVSDFASISDEAFTLLTLENNWEVWIIEGNRR